MSKKLLMRGNDALCEGAIIAGCRYYFGYPITPQNEIPAYMALRMPEVGGCFLQAESEIGSINMVWGASAAGKRAMTSSSSPGISLMQETISYLAGAELPAVIVNMVRGGPGLGNIAPAQSDYFQATRGGGHGDYNVIVLAPATVEEIAQLMIDAFDLADIYRTPVLVLGDGALGQMTEPLVLPEPSKRVLPEKDWILDGAKNREERVLKSLRLSPQGALEELNHKLQEKYDEIRKKEVLYDEYLIDDAEIVLVAFGMSSRVCKSSITMARSRGIKAGMIRPITLWPFPTDIIAQLADTRRVRAFLDVEMNMGQMIDDVRLAANGKKEVHFYGRTAGMLPDENELLNRIVEVFNESVVYEA
ncbi:MAG TPA: 3-methyl-2-oxobutanoate dehydrogenase subunit VorB [Spirochaetes bacterium]|nr:3-methyl-2-oxobutanoate dehydrogenase subunit VorB [Spirochaetota bacterium]